MQLTPPRGDSVRRQLSAAACLLLAAGVPGGARAEGGTTQVDATGLIYGEKGRTDIAEPTVRVTRLFSNGQSLSGEFGIDAMTGASPTGAMPSAKVQTVTGASGRTKTIPAGTLPTDHFQDLRGSLDLEWQRPIGITTTSLGTHFSREKDYQSLGLSGQFSIDLLNRLTTVTLGAGGNHDGVFPVLTDSTSGGGSGEGEGEGEGGGSRHAPSQAKNVTTVMAGVSQILSRRWMASVNVSRTLEHGYLTEPYKVVSLLDATGEPDSSISDRRPDRRERNDVLGSTVYHFARDVAYGSYRYYWDTWGVHSHTYDLKYRHELDDDRFIQPHLRYYTQTPADFFRYGLIHGPPAPEFATSDTRLGPLQSATIGATYGFRITGYPGAFSVRAEYLRQWGEKHPAAAIGVQRGLDLSSTANIGSILFGYSIEF